MKRRHSANGSYLSPGRAELRARVRSRFSIALLLSLAIHAFILSLAFHEPGFGLSRFNLPWADSRPQLPDLTVRLAEAPPVPVVPPGVPPAARKSRSRPSPRSDKGFDLRLPAVAQAPPSKKRPRARRRAGTAAPSPGVTAPQPEAEPSPQPKIIAQEPPRDDTFSVPAPEEAEAPKAEGEGQEEQAARLAREAEQAREEKEAVRLAQEQAAAAEEARRKAEDERREEEAQRLALEAARQQAEDDRRTEEARQVALEQAEQQAREEAKRQEEEARRLDESKKQEEAARLALEEQARQQEEARRTARAEEERRKERAAQLAQEKKAAEEEAQRKAEAAKLAQERAAEEATRQRTAEEARQKMEGERLKAETGLAQEQAAGEAERGRVAAQAGTPGVPSGKDIAAKALGQFRAPSGILPSPLPAPSAENPRRRTVSGAEREVALRWYVESWRSKIERNGPLNYRPLAGQRAPEDPIVVVAIRSDGSLEDVRIYRSSGLRELDEAARRIARLYAPYSRFPPDLARQYDVIEIRRVWQFDRTLRILEEM